MPGLETGLLTGCSLGPASCAVSFSNYSFIQRPCWTPSSQGLKPGLLACWGIVGEGLQISSSWGCASAISGQGFKCIREIPRPGLPGAVDCGLLAFAERKGRFGAGGFSGHAQAPPPGSSAKRPSSRHSIQVPLQDPCHRPPQSPGEWGP